MPAYEAGLTCPPRHPAGDDSTTCRVPRARCVTHPTHIGHSMSMDPEGLRRNTTSSFDIQDVFQRHYSSRAVQESMHINTHVWVEDGEDDNIIASREESTPKPNLSGMRRTHSDQIFASISESKTSVGSPSTLAKSKSHTDVSKVASDMSDPEQILYKNNGKATIDRNFFKSMAKMIKANRPSIADAEVVDEKACTHYTGCCASNSSRGEKTRYVETSWIEGHAMRVRIDLKFHLLHERMLACEASNYPNFGDETNEYP